MQKHRLIPPAALPHFTPVPRKPRFDGWTPERQQSFIEALADTDSVKHAAAKVGMSVEGAYMLRRAEGAEEFTAAWHAALDHGIRQLEDIALERAIHGIEVPVYSYGKLVGTRRVYNDRLIMFMLRNRAPDRFAASATAAGIRFHQEQEAEAEREAGPMDMDEVRKSILRKIEAIERQGHRQGKISVQMEGEEAKDFEDWRAERAERLGLPEPERLLVPPVGQGRFGETDEPAGDA
jgi:hypothetical protein